jgi:hypothetical protein
MRFYVNEHNQFEWEGVEQIVHPDFFKMHHAYNPKTFENDICMVHTSEPIKLEGQQGGSPVWVTKYLFITVFPLWLIQIMILKG